MMQWCRNCKLVYSDDYSVCSECGALLVEETPSGSSVKRFFKISISVILIFVILLAGNELRIIYLGLNIANQLKETVAWQEIFDMCEDEFEILRKGRFAKAQYMLRVYADTEIETFSFADDKDAGYLPQEEIDALDYIFTSKELPDTINEAWPLSGSNKLCFEIESYSWDNNFEVSIWYGKPEWGSVDPVILEKIRDGYYLEIGVYVDRITELGRVELWAVIIISVLLLVATIKFKPKPRKVKPIKLKPRKPLTGVDLSTLVQRSCEYATVTDKQMQKITGKISHRYECNVEFTYDNGNTIVLETSMEFYYEVRIGERKLLTVRDGYLDDFSDENGEFVEEINEFSLEDYDETIDIPLMDHYEPDELFTFDERKESTEEEAVLEQMLKKGELLPPRVFHSDSGSYSLPAYPPLLLIGLSGMYPFLRRIRDIQVLFEEAFVKASQDLLSDKSLPRTGKNTSSITLHNNVFQVCVKITEIVRQEDYEIKSDFFINDDSN